MILVDSSVWVDYFNDRGGAATGRLDSLLGIEAVAVGDLIPAEVQQGFRGDRDHRTARGLLLTLPVCALLVASGAISGSPTTTGCSVKRA